MDDNLRVIYGQYGETLEKELTDLAERLTDRINEDPALKSVVLFLVISLVLLAFLLLFISLFLAIGCICVMIYLCILTYYALTGGGTRN